jgi:predicted MFS family arabinose efflux permease
MHVVEHGFVAGWRAAMLFALAFTALFGVLIYAIVPSRKGAEAAPASS